MRNVNRCFKDIGLGYIYFFKFCGKRKEKLKILTTFYISHENSVKTFLK